MDIVDGKALLIRVRQPERFTALLEDCVYISDLGGGVHELMVRWTLDNVEILSRIGLKGTPSTINKDYQWPGVFQPMTHQRETSAFIVGNPKCFVFDEAGVGKTASAAWATDYLINNGRIKRVLVVCPLSIVNAAWRRDLFNVLPHRSVGIAHGTPKTRREIIAGKYQYVIINFDGIEIVIDELMAGGFDCVIVDECNHLKRVQTRRWKTFKKLITPDTRLVMMTGTPAAQSPEDAYGLAKLVNPTSVPSFFGGWKDMVMQKITMFKWVPRTRAKDLVFKVLQPAIRHTKQECLDLPDMMYEIRDVPMTSQQQKYYELLRKQMYMEAAGEEISAVNAAAKLTKLLQISCITGDTLVLSGSGWKRLDSVTTSDKVWDGVEWVTHGGVIYKGRKPVTVLDGVRMTADHRVLTVSGWRTAQEIIDGEPSKELSRAAVWLPDVARSDNEVRLGYRASPAYTSGSKEAVYDIHNAGPRNRFVVKGDNGTPIIVHNCGAVYSDNGSTVQFDMSSRLSELEAIIDECAHKVIVFAPFTHTIEMIENYLQKKKITCAVINGGVSLNRRGKIIQQFQDEIDPRVIIIQPQAAAHGVTLTAADTVVWFGPTTSVEIFLQANARAHRKGQVNKVTVYMIQGSPAENKVYASLNGKIDEHTRLIDLYNEVLTS